MSKYCCFFCPVSDYSEKSLDDLCPKCGRSYGFVLSSAPTSVGEYRIIRGLGRGFYGAAYVAEKGTFSRRRVIKISPTSFYDFAEFKKTPFEEETNLHARLAQNAAHIVDIEERFDSDVQFADGSIIKCHITVLEFVDGEPLRKYIDGEIEAGSAEISQIAIDLLRIRGELAANQLNHNDLHSDNLIVERLRPEARRPDALYGLIRVWAIDLGSMSDQSKSSDHRTGDLHHIAAHVDGLLSHLLRSPNKLDDRDYRTALALQGIVRGLLADAQNIRQPNPEDLIQQIEDAYYRASHHWKPWNNPLMLKGYGDHYNAQTLQSWNVPRLLVDPDNRWLVEVSKPGPQIITGMRGCGKTMLLRALDIHARAAKRDGETAADVIARLKTDRFVGLFISAQRLLDLRHSMYKLEHRVTRLYVNYALQAARALLHVEDVDSAAISSGAHLIFARAVSDYLEGADELRLTTSLIDLEAKLERIAVLTSQGNESYQVRQAPALVFPHLAEQLRMCAPIFADATILFLLDDVSTRHLEIDRIAELISALLFQNPICAFKFTSEWQTIELGLQSPGRNHPIRVDRDVAVFDLGADVLQTITSDRTKGNNFVAQILQQRASFHISHPNGYGPRDLLGNVPLEQIAQEIASSNTTSEDRKEVYRGLSCVTKVCVGDIGDVIKLYEEILKRAASKSSKTIVPIPKGIQSDSFLALSSSRLYDLNRRGGRFKNHALAFADAAHELLVRSHRLAESSRVRQYYSIYVRISSDDEATVRQQIDVFRELIDAGVFVYSGGSARTKTKDSDPIQQFKLSYRKIYGLAAFIGLADRDRFELSGDNLKEWLDSPSKEILLKSQTRDDFEIDAAIDEHPAEDTGQQIGDASADQPIQVSLFDHRPVVELVTVQDVVAPAPNNRSEVQVTLLTEQELGKIELGGILTGLGFEERTLQSNRILARSADVKEVYAVRYDVAGHAEQILQAWAQAKRDVREIPNQRAITALPQLNGLALIDISGLSKPLIFGSIRRELIEKGRVLVCHVSAQQHYPLQKDLELLLAAEDSDDPLVFLERLSHVLKGESGPYREMRLLDGAADPSRARAMLAFASSKHERLFSLLDKREFDYIEIIAPRGDKPRAKVAQFAAEFICQSYQNAVVSRIDTSDLLASLDYLDERYLELYGVGGANIEVGLSGSKIQAVAASILSARRKVAQAWYVAPDHFDEKRFSTGVAGTRIFDIRIP